jgi:hypothetical protein
MSRMLEKHGHAKLWMQQCADVIHVEVNGSSATRMRCIRLDSCDASPSELVLLAMLAHSRIERDSIADLMPKYHP